MTLPQRQAVVFISALALVALLFWLGGYDFNKRGLGVALGAGASIMFAAWLVGLATLAWGDK